MPIRLNENIIPTLQQRLTDNLPAIVTEINNNDSLPAPIISPQQILDYVPALADLYVFPTLGISDGPLRLVDDVGWGSTGEGELTVVIFEQDADLRTLAWKLRRLQQAVVRAIRHPTIIMGDAWGLSNFVIGPGPTLARDEGPRQFMSTSSVTFTYKSEQDVV